jgi:hypothetical protein
MRPSGAGHQAVGFGSVTSREGFRRRRGTSAIGVRAPLDIISRQITTISQIAELLLSKIRQERSDCWTILRLQRVKLGCGR